MSFKISYYWIKLISCLNWLKFKPGLAQWNFGNTALQRLSVQDRRACQPSAMSECQRHRIDRRSTSDAKSRYSFVNDIVSGRLDSYFRLNRSGSWICQYLYKIRSGDLVYIASLCSQLAIRRHKNLPASNKNSITE